MKLEFNMSVDEAAGKFGLDIEEIEPGYFKVLNPKKISLTKFQNCFDRCILIFMDLENITNEYHQVIDQKGVLYYFTPFFDDEHCKLSSVAEDAGMIGYYSKGYDHNYKEDNGIDSVFLKGEL